MNTSVDGFLNFFGSFGRVGNQVAVLVAVQGVELAAVLARVLRERLEHDSGGRQRGHDDHVRIVAGTERNS